MSDSTTNTGPGRPLPFGANDGAESPVGEPTQAHGNEGRLIETPPGGIMTEEVGSITGPVELFLEHGVARIRYQDAIDVYRVTGDVGDRTLDDVARILTADPGNDADGNARCTRLD